MILEVMIHVGPIKLCVRVEWRGHLRVWFRWCMIRSSVVLMRTRTRAKVVLIVEMALSAGYDSSALFVQLWREGELLAVENKRIFLLVQTMLRLCAFLSRCAHHINHPVQEFLDIMR